MTFFNVSGGVDIDDIEVDGDDVAGKDVVVLEADTVFWLYLFALFGDERHFGYCFGLK